MTTLGFSLSIGSFHSKLRLHLGGGVFHNNMSLMLKIRVHAKGVELFNRLLVDC